MLKPLCNLLKKSKEFKWGNDCEKVFQWAKNELVSDKFLIHFIPNKPIHMASDSSQYGLWAVLLHDRPEGTE